MQVENNVAVVVKIGGAAITDKSRLESINEEVLSTTVAHLTAAFKSFQQQGQLVAVVHGAGSFGHQQASRASVHKGGVLESPAVRQGFALTRLSVTKLNHMVVEALVKEGVPAIGISPCSSWTTRDRQVVQDGCIAVRAALRAGLLPVLHGDAVFDTQLGCTILGGDPILARLTQDLAPRCAVFLTNVPGIYSRHPTQPGAELLSRIEVAVDGTWVAVCTSSGLRLSEMELEAPNPEHDTTGGIRAKVAEAAKIAVGQGVEVRIAQAGTSHALAACMGGALPPGWVGTVVVAVEEAVDGD